MFIHWLTARSAASFKPVIAFYPVCIAIVWIPSVILGVLARADFPDLGVGGGQLGPGQDDQSPRARRARGPAGGRRLRRDHEFFRFAGARGGHHVHPGHRAPLRVPRPDEREPADPGGPHLHGRHPGRHLPAVAGDDRSIFKLGVWCFTGFAALFPIVVAAIFWKRSTKWGALASTLTVAVLWIYFVFHGWEDADYTIGGTGVMPVAVILLASTAAMIVGSLLTRAAWSARRWPSSFP